MKKTNILFGVVGFFLVALTVTGAMAYRIVAEAVTITNEDLTAKIEAVDNNSVVGDANLTQAHDSLALTVADDQAKAENTLKNVYLLIAQNGTSIQDLLDAQIALGEAYKMADVRLGEEIAKGMTMLGQILDDRITEVEGKANAANFKAAKNAAELADANAQIAELVTAVGVLSAEELERLEAKLERKLAALDRSMANNMSAIERQNKTMAKKADKLENQHLDGWFWQQDKAKAKGKLDARNAKAMARVADRIAKDEADIAKAKAELEAVREAIAKLTL